MTTRGEGHEVFLDQIRTHRCTPASIHVMSRRGRAGRAGNDVRRKKTFEAGEIAVPGCGDKGVEETS